VTPRTFLPLLLLLATGCMGGDADSAAVPLGRPGAPNPPLPEFLAGIDHLFLPLSPGTEWTYEGEDDGEPRRDEVRVAPGTETILGVPCTLVEQEVYVGGELAESTRHWFAQDVAGNVWLFGELSIEFVDGVAEVTEDSWQAGVDGAQPWVFFAAAPAVGDVYAGTHAGGIDVITVMSLDESEVVPAGIFHGCLFALETDPTDVEDADRIIYAPGVGLISEESPSGRIELAWYRVPG
jgi:hypothetical protein